jgi:hypothetical protein
MIGLTNLTTYGTLFIDMGVVSLSQYFNCREESFSAQGSVANF